MKTPREILLARHRAVETELDAIRSEVVAQCHEERRVAVTKSVLTYLPLLLLLSQFGWF